MALLGLSNELVAKLSEERTTEARRETAACVASLYAGNSISDDERATALQIIETLSHDIEVDVRAALSEALRECPILPNKLAVAFAEDVERVALPVLRYSQTLTDNDLIVLLRAGSSRKRVAVAKRETVSASVSDALVETEDNDAINALVANEGAEIGVETLHKALDCAELSDRFQQLFAIRSNLPDSIVERLASIASKSLRSELMRGRGEGAEESAETRDGEIDDPAASDSAPEGDEVARQFERMRISGKLSPIMVLRKLAEEDIAFFEMSMAAYASVTVAEARRMIWNEGTGGFKLAFRKSGFPPHLLNAFMIAFEVISNQTADAGPKSADDRNDIFCSRVAKAYKFRPNRNVNSILRQLARLTG